MTTPLSFSGIAAQVRGFIQLQSSLGVESVSAPEHNGEEFNRLALELFELQFQHVQPYRRFCEARGAAPDAVRDWSAIPAMPTSGFKDLELSSLAAERRECVFHSSGTTGQAPSRHFHDAESLALYEESLLSWFRRHLLAESEGSLAPDGMASVCLTPPHQDAKNSSLVYMFETIRRRLDWDQWEFNGQVSSDGAWTLDSDRVLGLLRDATAANRPVLLLGTAFNFVHLLDHLAQVHIRLRLPDGSRAVETGGYKGRSRTLPKEKLHSLITKWLSVPRQGIICEYGMSELGSQAYDCAIGQPAEGSRTFRFPPWARVQVISPETGREAAEGETGLIRIFDLANLRSVMAIQTEDLGVRRGDSFELLGRAALAEPRGCSLMTIG